MLRRFLLAGLLATVAMPAAAQTIGTPIFKSPYRAFRRTELAGYLSDPGEGISIALQGEYRMARPKFDFGIVVGFADASGNGDGIFAVGIDGRASLARHSQDFPLDAALTGGFGALFRSGDAGFLIPVGVSLGRQVLLEESKITFTPYVNPVIVPVFGNDNVVGNDVQFALGLGVDIALTQTFDIRVSGSLGDIDGIGIGLAWHR
jgi:hypothetical protein